MVFGARDTLPGQHVASFDEQDSKVTGVDDHQNRERNLPRPNTALLRAGIGLGFAQLKP